MLTRFYIFACVNWRPIFALLLVGLAAAALFAIQQQLVPQLMRVAINWEDRVTRLP